MNQLSFLTEDDAISEAARPLARTDDPVTSKLAARAMVTSGGLAAQRNIVLEALRRHPDTTSDELAEHAGIGRYVVARRLPELSRDGLALLVGRRHSVLTGRLAMVWRAALPGAAASHPRHE